MRCFPKLYEKLWKYLDDGEDLPDMMDVITPPENPSPRTPAWLSKIGSRPSGKEFSREQSLEEVCMMTGMARPVYDMEAVGDKVTMCCMVGVVKQTASGLDKQEAKEKAAEKVLQKLLLQFEEEEIV